MGRPNQQQAFVLALVLLHSPRLPRYDERKIFDWIDWIDWIETADSVE